MFNQNLIKIEKTKCKLIYFKLYKGGIVFSFLTHQMTSQSSDELVNIFQMKKKTPRFGKKGDVFSGLNTSLFIQENIFLNY